MNQTGEYIHDLKTWMFLSKLLFILHRINVGEMIKYKNRGFPFYETWRCCYNNTIVNQFQQCWRGVALTFLLFIGVFVTFIFLISYFNMANAMITEETSFAVRHGVNNSLKLVDALTLLWDSEDRAISQSQNIPGGDVWEAPQTVQMAECWQ